MAVLGRNQHGVDVSMEGSVVSIKIVDQNAALCTVSVNNTAILYAITPECHWMIILGSTVVDIQIQYL